MLLDFEIPIAELESKLVGMKDLAKDSGVDVEDAILALEARIQSLKEETFSTLTRWQRVQLSRHPERPYTLDYIHEITEDFIELHGDRNVGDDKAMIGGLGTINGKSYLIIGQQKGRNTKQRQMRNFGMANPEGYRKALRLMKMAEKFNIPIITLIDTPGAFPGIEAEERGQGEAIALNLREMFQLTVPVVCIVIGEGASGGALGIAIGDRVLMMENTWYSVISPESCSSILWRSWDFKEQAADALRLTANDMLGLKLIDGIVKEPLGGAQADPFVASMELKKAIVDNVEELEKLKPEERI
ncbi:MAG: acetyl-CoA carboxylase carboxyltransferase subunit alpha, partial [Cyclobacteriaceae bacterium]|nr:acetyl-CoA carboxylase carboxyltransferase subunit alpha [Cyclobacteriaceae bacterium]